ncbi:phage Gp37/Gp68 family protein [Anaeromyxobacter sp. SG66]|uniref:phage Gp37/Gp68 family protein n=1 Tax=Anaeromyxobacter sp. SG66 TaxID=2925410 RepID=UPI001F5685CC|nr:phage Gp37/Gp68 family protein [Anaeromyxobacter sp. SG66]
MRDTVSAFRSVSEKPDQAQARSTRDQCAAGSVAFWFKQRAGKRPHALPKDLDGAFYRQLPRRELGALPSARERKDLMALAKKIYIAGS